MCAKYMQPQLEVVLCVALSADVRKTKLSILAPLVRVPPSAAVVSASVAIIALRLTKKWNMKD